MHPSQVCKWHWTGRVVDDWRQRELNKVRLKVLLGIRHFSNDVSPAEDYQDSSVVLSTFCRKCGSKCSFEILYAREGKTDGIWWLTSMKVKCNYHTELSSLHLMGGLSHSHVCWRDSTEGHKQLSVFLEGTGDNFQKTQVIKGLTGWWSRGLWGWTESCLNWRAPRVVISSMKTSRRSDPVVYPRHQ